MNSDDFGLSRAVSLENSDCEERREEVETVVREPIGKLSLSGEISSLYNISLVSTVICVHKNVSQCHYSLITEYQPTPTQGSRCHHSHREGRSLSPPHTNHMHFTFIRRKCVALQAVFISWQWWWWWCWWRFAMRATARNVGSVSVQFLTTRLSLTATGRWGKPVTAQDPELVWRPRRLTAPPNTMRSINIYQWPMSELQSSANGLTIATHFSPLSPKFGCAGFAELISLVITRTTRDKVII